MDSIDSLSRQQRRCLEGVAQGKSSPQIAHDLGIAESTVNGHVEAAVRKLGAPNRRMAAAMLSRIAVSATPEKMPGDILPVDPSSFPLPDNAPDRVEEERVEFAPPPLIWERPVEVREPALSPLRVVGMIALIATCLAILALALDPLVQSASKLANSIHLPTGR